MILILQKVTKETLVWESELHLVRKNSSDLEGPPGSKLRMSNFSSHSKINRSFEIEQTAQMYHSEAFFRQNLDCSLSK